MRIEGCDELTVGYDDGWRAGFIKSDLDVSRADCMMIRGCWWVCFFMFLEDEPNRCKVRASTPRYRALSSQFRPGGCPAISQSASEDHPKAPPVPRCVEKWRLPANSTS